jgi:beta-lactamase regulating signal transducer with metallopeptidase domain
MNTEWIVSHFAEALGWTLAHSLWQLLVVAAGMWLLFRFKFLNSPQKKYMLGLGGLGVMCCMFVGTFIMEFLSFQDEGKEALVFSSQIQASAQPVAGEMHWSAYLSGRIAYVLPYLVYFWVIGVVFYFVRHLGNFVALKQLKARSQQSVPKKILKSIENIKFRVGLNFTVDFRLSSEITVPITYGIFKPIVLLPLGLIMQLSPAQLEAIIAHELAHIRRHDFAVNLLQSVLEILFFYHPAFWWVNGLVKEAREHIADDIAIQAGVKAIDLANALAIVANDAVEKSPELAMAAHSSNFPLLNRIKRMLGNEPARFSNSPIITKTMILTLIFSAILFIGNANEIKKTQDRWVTTTLESKFDGNTYFLMDTLPQSIEVEDTVIIINKDVTIDLDQEVSEDVEVVIHSNNQVTTTIHSVVSDSLPLPQQPPVLNLSPAPIANFSPPVFNDSLIHYTQNIMGDFGDSIHVYARNIVMLQGDTSVLSQEQKKKLERKMELLQKKMEKSQKLLEQKMKAWEKEFQPQMKEFEQKMEAWQKENEPKIKEFEKKMEIWAKAQSEKFKALEKEFELKAKEFLEKEE